jgi:FADH2 O2-dependent halogenase
VTCSYGSEAALIDEVYRLIEPFDVAGLCSSPHNHWYPIDPNDLKNAAAKVSATADEIEAMLQRSGFYAPKQTLATMT